MRLPLSFLPSFYSQVQTATNRNSSYSSIFWETVRNVSFSTIPCLTNSLILNNFEFCTERRREMREERRGEGKIGFKASNKSGGSDQHPLYSPPPCPIPFHLLTSSSLSRALATFLLFSASVHYFNQRDICRSIAHIETACWGKTMWNWVSRSSTPLLTVSQLPWSFCKLFHTGIFIVISLKSL